MALQWVEGWPLVPSDFPFKGTCSSKNMLSILLGNPYRAVTDIIKSSDTPYFLSTGVSILLSTVSYAFSRSVESQIQSWWYLDTSLSLMCRITNKGSVVPHLFLKPNCSYSRRGSTTLLVLTSKVYSVALPHVPVPLSLNSFQSLMLPFLYTGIRIDLQSLGIFLSRHMALTTLFIHFVPLAQGFHQIQHQSSLPY